MQQLMAVKLWIHQWALLLDGLAMGTRCGAIDPAVVTFIMQKEDLTAEQMDMIMNKNQELWVFGVSSDF